MKGGKASDLDLISNIRHAERLKQDDANLALTPFSDYEKTGYRIWDDGMIEEITKLSDHKHKSKDGKADLAKLFATASTQVLIPDVMASSEFTSYAR